MQACSAGGKESPSLEPRTLGFFTMDAPDSRLIRPGRFGSSHDRARDHRHRRDWLVLLREHDLQPAT